jgi:hypothetical protein
MQVNTAEADKSNECCNVWSLQDLMNAVPISA